MTSRFVVVAVAALLVVGLFGLGFGVGIPELTALVAVAAALIAVTVRRLLPQRREPAKQH